VSKEAVTLNYALWSYCHSLKVINTKESKLQNKYLAGLRKPGNPRACACFFDHAQVSSFL